MEGTYTVIHNEKMVGNVILTRQGLYWKILCRCQLLGDQMLHLQLQINHEPFDLGLLIPTATGLELCKLIPVKQIGAGKPAFSLRSRTAKAAQFIPVASDVPFPWLHHLDHCVFAKDNGKTGVKLHLENNGDKEKNNA